VTSVYNTLKKLSEYDYQVWQQIVYAQIAWAQVYHVPLSADRTESQLRRYRDLFGDDEPVPRRYDELMYCPNCTSICSLVDQSKATGSLSPKRFVAREVAGFANVFVQTKRPEPGEQRRLYCGKRTGRKSLQCANTELKSIHLTGRMAYCYDKAILICSQLDCGGRMQLNVLENTYNELVWQCTTCSIRQYNLEHKRKGAKVKKGVGGGMDGGGGANAVEEDEDKSSLWKWNGTAGGGGTGGGTDEAPALLLPKKRRGRPKGSKNKNGKTKKQKIETTTGAGAAGAGGGEESIPIHKGPPPAQTVAEALLQATGGMRDDAAAADDDINDPLGLAKEGYILGFERPRPTNTDYAEVADVRRVDDDDDGDL